MLERGWRDSCPRGNSFPEISPCSGGPREPLLGETRSRGGPIETEGPTPSRYRWVMLGLSCLGGLTQGLLWLSTVPLVLAVEHDLNLNATQVGVWVNIHLTLTMLLAIPLGLTVDRWGVKKIGGMGISLMTLGALARGFATSYTFLLAASAVFGIGFITFFVCLPKALAMWFPPREIGMANGVFLAGYGFGSALGLSIVPPIFGDDWQQCFRVLGSIGIVTTACWWFLARERLPLERGGAVPESGHAMTDSFKRALRTRFTWLLTLVFFFYAAGFTSWFTFGFPFLVRFRDISQNAAGLVLTVTMIGYTLAALSMPALSDSLGRRRPLLFFYAALAASLFLALLFWKSTTAIWITALLIGMSFGTINPLVFTIAAEAKELGPALMGAAVGIISSLGSIAGFVIPILNGEILGSLNQATEQAFHAVWLLAAVWATGIFGCGLLLKETGRSSQLTAP